MNLARASPDRRDMAHPAWTDELCAWFARHHGQGPQGVWRAPGRVNIIGEHTDYNCGFVLPIAISEGVTVCAARRSDNRLVLTSRQAGQATVQLDELTPGAVTGWAAYPAGVAWALQEAGHAIEGASIAIDGDLPAGAGLSSSAALECAVALALTELSGVTVPGTELVRITRQAENDFVGVPTGMMDQSASLLSSAGQALLFDCSSERATPVPVDLVAAGRCLMIIDTQVRHSLSDGRYAKRSRECAAAARALGVLSLREASGGPEELAALQDDQLRRRARHVIRENRRVLKAAQLLQSGDLGAIGKLMTASHRSLRDDFEVSWPQANAAAAAALAAGADGARMIGAGFGGSVLALLPIAEALPVAAAVRSRFGDAGWPEPTFRPALPSAGARRLR